MPKKMTGWARRTTAGSDQCDTPKNQNPNAIAFAISVILLCNLAQNLHKRFGQIDHYIVTARQFVSRPSFGLGLRKILIEFRAVKACRPYVCLSWDSFTGTCQ